MRWGCGLAQGGRQRQMAARRAAPAALRDPSSAGNFGPAGWDSRDHPMDRPNRPNGPIRRKFESLSGGRCLDGRGICLSREWGGRCGHSSLDRHAGPSILAVAIPPRDGVTSDNQFWQMDRREGKCSRGGPRFLGLGELGPDMLVNGPSIHRDPSTPRFAEGLAPRVPWETAKLPSRDPTKLRFAYLTSNRSRGVRP
jgi:hypothetical protein